MRRARYVVQGRSCFRLFAAGDGAVAQLDSLLARSTSGARSSAIRSGLVVSDMVVEMVLR